MSKTPLITPVLIAGCVILMISFAVRASFGVFQIPIATEFGWLRSDFSLAIAIQNLAWGIGQPLFGALAERFGDRKAIIAGALLYAAGLVLSAYAVTPGEHQLLAIWSVSATCSKVVAITRSSISSTPAVPAFTVPTRGCRSRSTTRSTTRSACTRQRKSRTS